jgi:hypothetical protein
MRILRTPVGRLFLLGLAVALAVLVFGQGGARPAAAQPATPHYECYDIMGGTPPSPAVNVKLQTQLGVDNSVAVGTAAKLCLPAGKDGPIPGPDVPHLKCYNIVGKYEGRTAKLQTQFGVEENVALGRAGLLCVPAVKTVLLPSPGSPSGPLVTVPHYECYEIVSGKNDPTGTHELTTQFGTASGVDVGPSKYLCLAAIKTILPGGTPEGDLSAQDLECYTLTGQPASGRSVEMQTQFGLEGAPPGAPVEIGPATMLCTPVIKLAAVGGIAELPASAGASGEEAAAPAESSGWSAGAYAALACGLAAAAVVIAGGGWYARRRFTKS